MNTIKPNLISYNNDIIARPFINVIKNDIPFKKVAEECAACIGGNVDDWTRRNKKLRKIFHGDNTRLKIGARLMIPHNVVNKALETKLHEMSTFSKF